jgi:hypothetical protein
MSRHTAERIERVVRDINMEIDSMKTLEIWGYERMQEVVHRHCHRHDFPFHELVYNIINPDAEKIDSSNRYSNKTPYKSYIKAQINQ